MNVYKIEIRKNKSQAMCRLCHKKIDVRSICVFSSIDNGFNKYNMVNHCDCFLTTIIKDVKKIQLDSLKKEYEKFDRIEKIFKGSDVTSQKKKLK